MIQTIKKFLSIVALLLSPMVSNAALVSYDSGLNQWSVSNWDCSSCSFGGDGDFAPSSFSGYTSTNGVAMLRNFGSTGWWIGDVMVSTFSSYYEDDSVSLDVTGATWGGSVNYFTTQAAGSRFYVASNDLVTDLTGLSIGDAINGTLSWGGTDAAPTVTYTAFNSVPVPGTLALLGIGLAGLSAASRKRK